MPERTLEQRVREIEDRLEIYNLIASHPPSADTGARDHVQTPGPRTAPLIAAPNSAGRSGRAQAPAASTT